MKRTTLAIAIGSICAGLAGGAFAQQTQDHNNATAADNASTAEMGQQQNERHGNANDTVDVNVDQEPTEIEVQQESPNITVEQPEPTVTIEQPEPNVTVDEADPNITVEQRGETEVTVEQAEDADVDVNRSDEARDQDEQARQEGRDRNDQHADREGDLMSRQVSDLEGMTVINQEGEEIGDIQHIARHHQNNDLFAIVSVGGFWGFGTTEVALPLNEMQFQDDQLIVNTDYGSDQIEDSANEYDESDYQEVDSNMTLAEAKQTS